ncbi:MAG TPA: hypothetical protein VE991_00455 [Acidimicrobiales bacterium]|nr:hypothetical protein [Acidimicrobiales bacterium]
MSAGSTVSVARRLTPVALAALGLGLAACSSSPASSTGSTSTTAAASASASASAGLSTTDQLKQLTAAVQSMEHGTYRAVYSAVDNGQTQTVTFEQQPPKSYFSAGDGAVIDTGTTTYFCSTSGGQQTCFSTSASSDPLAGLLNLFSPATAVSALQAAESEVAAHLAGASVSFSSQTFAGQDATCVTASDNGQSGKYCVTKSGLLAYEGSGGNSFTLTSFSASVNASDFAPPAGASVQTIPSIPSGSY